jgi:hypothetical protein
VVSGSRVVEKNKKMREREGERERCPYITILYNYLFKFERI